VRHAALALQASDTSLLVGAGSALAMGLPLVLLVLLGHPHGAVYAAFGAFTGLYAADRPYPRRARALALVASGFVVAVALGAVAGLVLGPWAWVAALAAAAATAKWACDSARVGSPGAWMFSFAFAASSQAVTGPGDVTDRALLAAAGAVLAGGASLLGVLVEPHGPPRRATAAALEVTREVVGLGDAATSRSWHRAHTAIIRAESAVAGAAEPHRSRLRSSLRDAERLLTDAVLDRGGPDTAAEVRRLRGAATELRGSRPAEVAALRRRHGRHAAVLRLVAAARVLLGVAAAGAGAELLHLGHPYWAPLSAAAVLQSSHVRMTWHRSLQRGLGTAAGLLVAAALLAMHPSGLVVAVLVVVLQLGIEVLIGRNYALGVLFITPVTMLLSELLLPTPAERLVTDRLVGVALGIVVGLGAALLVAHPRAAMTLRHAMERCRVAMAHLDAQDAVGRDVAATEELRDALVELRTAEETARGETWPVGVLPSAVAEVEDRAYRLLATRARFDG
jgi:uncharacterized membrane protein YccC